MYNQTLANFWEQILILKLRTKTTRVSNLASNQGFTLIEMLVVIIMIGVLSAIAAPSWLGFVNRQRINKANDAVLAALQETQREAKKQKLSYSASFRLNNNLLEVAIYPSKQSNGQSSAPSNWRSLVNDFEIKPGQLILGSNITNENSVAGAVKFNLQGATNATNKPMTVTFDHFGALDLGVKTRNEGLTRLQDTKLGGTKGLIIALSIPKQAGTNQESDVKRCVAVKTLMGSMQTGKDKECT